ncbi:MAG: peroxide stress protein YaaA [Eubacterium sp.]|nr:peroxide stress protein YaaA [Eubacterium sp.]
MKIIISPAKKMKVETDLAVGLQEPAFRTESRQVLEYLSGLSFSQLKSLWACNDKIVSENAARIDEMLHFPEKNLTPAVLAYNGIAFTYMAPEVFEYGQFDYVEENLRILSAFYGVLRPMDKVAPYRLEMQAKAHVAGTKNLYEFWGDKLYKACIDESRTIINLASGEYSKCIEKYLTPDDRYISINFCERVGEKLVTKGVYAKMCRGEMVREMARQNVRQAEELKKLEILGHKFREAVSGENVYTFVREPQPTSF